MELFIHRLPKQRLLAISIGICYLWFGVLKFFPGLSPADTLAKETISNYQIVLQDSLARIEGASLTRVKRRLKNITRGIESDFSLVKSYTNSINKYLVELHKKFSIPFASIVFILIGAPLGMMARKSGFTVSMTFSLGFFIIYWAFLISGEEFADRGYLSPALSMWLPNLVLFPLGLFMCYRHSQEQRFLKLDFLRLFF